MADKNTEMPASQDIPPEIISQWIEGGEKEKDRAPAARKPAPRPHEKAPKRDEPEEPPAPPEDDDPFGGYYPDEEGDGSDAPEDASTDERLDEILNNTALLIERFRSLGNISVSIEGQTKAMAQAMGLSGKKAKEETEPADNKLLKAIGEKIDKLAQSGINAQLSEEFDNLKPESIKAMLDAFDEKLKKNYKIGKSYADNLESAMRKATMSGLVWGLCGGIGGSLIFTLLAAFLLR